MLSNVLGYAVDLGKITANPVPAFRGHVRRRQRTQRGRAQAEMNIRPIEDPWDCEAMLAAAMPEGPEAFVYVLLGLDAGLRQGEALGLRWGAIGWADGSEDLTRHLLIDASRPRGGDLGPTKSGRSREVAMSRRLHRALSVLYRQRWNPSPDRFVVGDEFSSGRESGTVVTRICGIRTQAASSRQAFNSGTCRPNSDTRMLR